MTNSDTRDNFKVVIKSRPLIKREKDCRQTVQWKIVGDTIEGLNPLCSNRYTFDHIYDETSTTLELYNEVARPIVEKSVEGFNGTIFAYGQTSSGKTYTMLGDRKSFGVIRLAAKQIFSDIEKTARDFIVKVNYLEIYNEKVYDLLNDRKEIKIQELPNGELKFGCTGQHVRCEDDIMKLVEAGNNHRKVAETNMNVQSSRSHAILQIGIESVLEVDGASKVSVLNLVDLAGSERADSTGATGERLKEASNINKSLLTLSIVINKLSEEPDGHIGYRDSKLTRILQPSLGGNAMTVMICAITPAAVEETNLTLGFATRAKKIENKPVVNETVSDAVEVKRAKKHILELEAQLAAQSEEIANYRKKAEELSIAKHLIIQAPKKVPVSNRRRTWAANSNTNISVMRSISEEREAIEKEKKSTYQLMFSDLGRRIECTEEQWDSFLNDTLGQQIIDFDEGECESATPAFKFPHQKPLKSQEIEQDANTMYKTPNQQPARRSLLRTPKSLKQIYQNNDTTTPSVVASPIALDKDNRIRMLEQELEELRHFQQTETMLRSSPDDSTQAELEQKLQEIDQLKEHLDETRRKVSDFESRLESAQSELKDARKEKGIALQAKVMAEQNMTSIEFEYEQHKARASRREKELVEQLESVGNDEAMKVLKEKLATATEKSNSLETQLWQASAKHSAEIESLKAKVTEEQARHERMTKLDEKLKRLQTEYDELSVQLVDSIQENDQLKEKNKDLEAIVEKLNEKIGNVNKENADMKIQLSAPSVNDQLEADLQKKNQTHLLEMQALEEKHRKEIDVLKEQQTSQLANIQKLEQTIAEQLDEINKLEKYYRESVENLTQKHSTLIHELEQDMVDQKDEIFNIKTEHDELLAHCNNLEHTNTLLENAWTQARMTVDLVMKETELLRKGYNDLKMSIAVQELEHLKLQRTMSEYDDTVNFSVLNETASNSLTNNTPSVCNNTHNITNSTYCDKEDSPVSSNLTTELQKSNEERDSLALRLDLIIKRITSVMQDELSDVFVPGPSEDQILDALATNLKKLKDKCNQLELDKKNNDEMISALKSESEKLSEELKLLQSEEKQFKDQVENEKMNNVQLTQRIDELNQKLMEYALREQHLNEQTEELNEIKAKQRSEITRLQQMMSANASSGTELTLKMNKEIEEVNDKLREALAQSDSFKSQTESTKELLIAKELEIKQHEVKFEEKLKEYKCLENTIKSTKAELESLQQNLSEMKKTQEENDSQMKTIKESVIAKDTEIQDLRNEVTSLKASLNELEQNQIKLNEKKLLHRQNSNMFKKLLHEKTDDLEEKEKQLESANLEIDKLKMNFQELQENLVENQRKISEFEQIIADHERSKDEQIVKIRQELNRIITDKETQLKKSSDELEKLKETVDQNEITKKDHMDTYAEKERMIDELKKAVELSTEMRENLEKEHKEELNKIQRKLEDQLAQKEQESKIASNKIVELEKCISEHLAGQQQLDTIKRDLSDKLTEKDAILREYQANLSKNDAKLTQLQETIDKSEIAVRDNKQNLARKEQEIAKLKETIADYERLTKQNQEERMNVQRELKDQIVQKEKELRKASDEIAELNEIVSNYERMKKDNQGKFGELQHRITVLEEEQESLERINQKLQSQIEKQTEEMSVVQRKLSAMKLSKEKIEFEKQKLIEEMNVIQNKRHGSHSSDALQMQSPRRSRDNRDVDIESLLNENRTLKSKQTMLEDEVQELRKSAGTVRKIKRQSVHDDTRRISGFDSTMIDLGTQTDPVDEKCSCSDMAKQITKLKQEKVIIEAKYATFRLSTGVDDLQVEVKNLKTELSAAKTKLSRLNIEYENLSDKHEKLKLKSVIAQQKSSSTDAGVQTDVQTSSATFVDQMDWNKAQRRVEKYKKAYEDLVKVNKELRREYDEKLAKSIEGANLLDEIRPKYDQYKRLCTARLDEIKELKQKLANTGENETELKSELEVLKKQLNECYEHVTIYKRKYEHAKSICDSRKRTIENLEKQRRDGTHNNENVPVN